MLGAVPGRRGSNCASKPATTHLVDDVRGELKRKLKKLAMGGRLQDHAYSTEDGIMAAGNTDALPANTNAGTGSRFRDAAHAARGVELALLEAPQMAVVPDFRDNYHLEDLDHHHQRGRSLLGVRRCAGCLHASNSAALSRMHVCALHSLIHTGPPSQVIAHRCLSRRWRRRFGRYRRHAQEVPAATASAQGGRTAAPHTPLTPCTRVCCDRWDRGGHWRGRGRARWPGNDRAVAHRRSRCGRHI